MIQIRQRFVLSPAQRLSWHGSFAHKIGRCPLLGERCLAVPQYADVPLISHSPVAEQHPTPSNRMEEEGEEEMPQKLCTTSAHIPLARTLDYKGRLERESLIW